MPKINIENVKQNLLNASRCIMAKKGSMGIPKK